MSTRHWTPILACLAIGLGCLAQAADPTPETKPVPAPAAQATPSKLLELRAEMHRTMADLLQARNAENPDPKQIQTLTEKLQGLRKTLAAEVSAPAATCPWGGPGLGPAYGRGYGRGPGWGGGPGYGGGYGRGYGRGWGGGPGYGRGAGWFYQDADHDGVCDNFERVWGKP